MKRQKHWEKTWSDADPHKVGWYQESPEVSFRLVKETGLNGGKSLTPENWWRHNAVLQINP